MNENVYNEVIFDYNKVSFKLKVIGIFPISYILNPES